MSDQIPSPGQENQPASSPAPTPPVVYQDSRDARRSERDARRGSNSTAWIGGAILILVGVILLLQSMRGFYLNNWWALFILIPAFGAFADAWNRYRQDGRLSRRARGGIISGCVFLLVTAAFLFNWNWGVVLPVLLIVWGVSLLLNSVTE